MKKKTILRLFLLIAISISLYSCIHDDVSASSDPSSIGYTNKSLWKEDEKYIKNVKEVFDKYANKDYFATNFGNIYWDYAVTMGTQETFLEVPVIKNGKVNFILVVYKDGDRVFFKKKEEESSRQFFKALVFNDRTKLKEAKLNNSSSPTAKAGCVTIETTWTWTNADGSAGPTYTYVEMHCLSEGPALPCQALDIDAPCGGTGGSTGSSGGGSGGGGYPYPQASQTPCEKTKSILTKAGVQAKIEEMKAQSKLPPSDPNSGEIGYKFNADGTSSPKIIGGKHEVDLGDITGYQGGYHNHTPTGIKMFSPPDIVKLLSFAMVQNGGSVQDGFMGMIGSEPCSTCPGGVRYYHYIINFNGSVQELAGFLYNNNWDLESLKAKYERREYDLAGNPAYVDSLGDNLNSKGLEKLFFDTLKTMGMESKVNLQKIEDNGTVQNITLNSSGSSTIATPCP